MENRFFTILFLPSNPAKVKKLIVSNFLIKSLTISALVLLIASTIVFLDYIMVKKKEIDLTSLREQNRIQNVQLQTFADKINNMEVEIGRLRNLDTKIRVLTETDKITNKSAKNETISLGGMGGPEPSISSVSFKWDDMIKDMMVKLDRLNIEAALEEQRLHEVHTNIQDEKTLLASTPSGWPTGGYLTSGFGGRMSPFNGTYEFHEGIDIAAPQGSDVIASGDGVVTFAGYYPDLGNSVTINHGYGFVTRYGHLSSVSVQAGQSVKGGQKVGEIGSTGSRSTGPHLHYEVVVNGSKVNPSRFLN